MIHGAPFWNDKSKTYYSQENNAAEELLRKREENSWLETCGPTAAVSCLAALDYNLNIYCPGPYKPQPENCLQDFFNDPRNYKELERIRRDTDPVSFLGNRIPQWYPFAVKEVFGALGQFLFTSGIEITISALKKGYAVQLCLISPGHFIAAVAYDDESSEIIFNDPWPAGVGGDGFNRRMDSAEFDRNVKNYAIIYIGRKV